MFLRPEIDELNVALAQHRVVLLYGVPGSGKHFLAERAKSSSFEKITQIPPSELLKASTGYWFDAPDEKDFEALKRTIAKGDQSWLITSHFRIDIKDAKFIHLKALDEASATKILSHELERRGLGDRVDPENILPYLLGNPQAISKAVEFLEINGAAELGRRLKKEGFAFDPFLRDESERFWERLSHEGQKAMRIASVFSSFTANDLETFFGTNSSDLSALIDHGLIERSADSARFHVNAYGKMLVSRHNSPDKTIYKLHGKWALASERPNEIRISSNYNAGTKLGIHCLSWLVENGFPFDAALLENAVQKLKNKKYVHSANLFYAHAARSLAEGSTSILRRHLQDCDYDQAVREEMHALLAKTEQRFEDALLHYTNTLACDLSPCTRLRNENNRIAVLWESGRVEDAIAAARTLATENTEKGGAIALSNLAVMLHNEEDFDAARSSYENAMERHRKLDNQRYLAITYFDLGTLAHEQGQFQAALAS